MLAGDSPEPLDISALAALFETEAMEHVISAERIVERVARAFHVGLDDIRGQDRQSQIVRPRQLSMYLARKWTGLSLAEIGQYFGGRDHSTVRHACQKVETSLQDDAELRSILRQLEAEMGC
jgi:chromosomal replication initiator protein